MALQKLRIFKNVPDHGGRVEKSKIGVVALGRAYRCQEKYQKKSTSFWTAVGAIPGFSKGLRGCRFNQDAARRLKFFVGVARTVVDPMETPVAVVTGKQCCLLYTSDAADE